MKLRIMNINTTDKIFAVITFLLGSYIAASAPSYGYMRDTVPGSGFFPLWIGLIIAGLSIINFVKSVARTEILTENFDRTSMIKSAGIAVALLAFILTIDYLGMLIGSGLLVLAIGWIIHPKWESMFAVKIVATAIIFPVVSHFLFGVYLNVLLPVGSFGI